MTTKNSKAKLRLTLETQSDAPDPISEFKFKLKTPILPIPGQILPKPSPVHPKIQLDKQMPSDSSLSFKTSKLKQGCLKTPRHAPSKLQQLIMKAEENTETISNSNELSNASNNGPPVLRKSSYTALRLLHSMPAQMDLESQVLTIGPIPVEWILAERPNWKRRYTRMRKALSKAWTWRNSYSRKKTSIEILNDNALMEIDGNIPEFDSFDSETDEEYNTNNNSSVKFTMNPAQNPNTGELSMGHLGVQNENSQDPHVENGLELPNSFFDFEQDNDTKIPAKAIPDQLKLLATENLHFVEPLDESKKNDASSLHRNSDEQHHSELSSTQQFDMTDDNTDILPDNRYENLTDSDTSFPSEDDLLDSSTTDEDGEYDTPQELSLKTHDQPRPVLIGVRPGQASHTLRNIMKGENKIRPTAKNYLDTIQSKYDLKTPKATTNLNTDEQVTSSSDVFLPQPICSNSIISSSDLSTSSLAPSFVTAQESMYDSDNNDPPMISSFNDNNSSSNSYESFATAPAANQSDSITGNNDIFCGKKAIPRKDENYDPNSSLVSTIHPKRKSSNDIISHSLSTVGPDRTFRNGRGNIHESEFPGSSSTYRGPTRQQWFPPHVNEMEYSDIEEEQSSTSIIEDNIFTQRDTGSPNKFPKKNSLDHYDNGETLKQSDNSNAKYHILSQGDMGSTHGFDHIDRMTQNYNKIERHAKSLYKITKSDVRDNINKFLDTKQTGEAIRIESLLTLVKWSDQEHIPPTFSEVESCDTKILEPWKEYVMVVRKTGEFKDPLILQFYSSRLIKKIDKINLKKPVSKIDSKINFNTHAKFYSTLDKTVVLWTPNKNGTKIYIFRSKTQYESVRLLAFFQKCIGVVQPNDITVNIPDFSLSLEIRMPWKTILSLNQKYALSNELDDMLSYKDLKSILVRGNPIVAFVIASIVKSISKIASKREDIDFLKYSQKLGLAWRRYDRLEWVREIAHESIHSDWVLNSSHDLELRPKQPYPTKVTFQDGIVMEQPIPVEGFLLRLSSWSGGQYSKRTLTKDKKLEKLFYKKLYFHSHDNLLFFSKPSKSVPPAPQSIIATLSNNETTNENRTFVQNESTTPEVPLVYKTRPYRTDEEGEIEWLNGMNVDPNVAEARDRAAAYEMQRRVSMIVGADGVLDLCEVDTIRKVVRDYENIDSNIGVTNVSHFSSLFQNRLSAHEADDDENGEIDGFSDSTVFEIVMNNGVIIRLQSYNQFTRDTWISKLSELSRYWKRRVYEDIALLNTVRQTNLERLHIDEDYEAFVGEATPKWETSSGIAHPSLYHISRLAWGRSISIRGRLYQKPNKHATFRRYFAVLTHGHLMLYNIYHRSGLGNAEMRADYRKFKAISLENCYVYSGPVTQTELLQRDRWFDRNHPGHHSLPRVYPDGWKSAEEEIYRCFVLWFGQKRPIATHNSNDNLTSNNYGLSAKDFGDQPNNNIFKNNNNSSIKMTTRLGVTGMPIVFMARSRQERDMWVVALNTEIERLVQTSNVSMI